MQKRQCMAKPHIAKNQNDYPAKRQRANIPCIFLVCRGYLFKYAIMRAAKGKDLQWETI